MPPGLLEQVVLNLAVNAGDAMPLGGRLCIQTSVVVRTPRDRRRGHMPFLKLEVSDTGAGIPPEIRQLFFDPFFTTKALGRGTGLGLAIVTAIVQDAGGEIAVDSEIGCGTSFRVYLPLCDAKEQIDAE
jgi:signal transduction histidine kinase